MIGLTALTILVVYILSVRKLARFIARHAGFDESTVKVGVVFVVLLLLPFVDEIVGRVQFEQECKKVQGYEVLNAIKGAQTLRYDYAPPAVEQPRALIPITKGISRVIDVESGVVVMQYENLHTPGGWVMRAGLNLGNLSSCNQVHVPKVLESYGFEYVKDGFFKRNTGG